MKYGIAYVMILSLLLFASCKGQDKAGLPVERIEKTTQDTALPQESTAPLTQKDTTYRGPKNITRSVLQAKNGDIWIAAFDGVFRYDGQSFTNITSEVSSARFFSLLEDSKGSMWFGSIGSGAYRYDGKSFQNFTTTEGLISNEVVCIYEDKAGNIWFGANGGVSVYDGKFIRNYKIVKDTMMEAIAGFFTPALQRPPTEVNAITEDKEGNFWLATRGNTFLFDGNTFTTVKYNDTPFSNARWLIEDRNGNIWIGGMDGLWRYDGSTFNNITKDFTGYVYEDKSGNIWTSGQGHADGRWGLSRYDKNSLTDQVPIPKQMKSKHPDNRGMSFGLMEAADGNIWFGALDGVYIYDGTTSTPFKDWKN